MTKVICNECETVAHCMKNGWNGCVPKQQALNKMADNARELGLDYEQPAPLAKPHEQEPVGMVKDLFTTTAWEKLDVVGSTKVYLNPSPEQSLVVPDFLTAHDPETLEYRNGWNDCRQLMMEMYRREIK